MTNQINAKDKKIRHLEKVAAAKVVDLVLIKDAAYVKPPFLSYKISFPRSFLNYFVIPKLVICVLRTERGRLCPLLRLEQILPNLRDKLHHPE